MITPSECWVRLRFEQTRRLGRLPRPFGILCNNRAGGAGETEPHTASVLRPTVALLTPRTVDQIYFGQSPRIRQALGFKSDPVERAGSVQFDSLMSSDAGNSVTFV